jgi:hypothetical protein
MMISRLQAAIPLNCSVPKFCSTRQTYGCRFKLRYWVGASLILIHLLSRMIIIILGGLGSSFFHLRIRFARLMEASSI